MAQPISIRSSRVYHVVILRRAGGVAWGDGRGEMASWVAWGVLAIVAVLLGLVGTFFSVRTLRWFSVITAAAAVIAITRYGYGIAQPPSSNFANAFTSGADAVIEALLRVLWLGQTTPTPGPIGRWVVAALILLGYRMLEAWAMRRQARRTFLIG